MDDATEDGTLAPTQERAGATTAPGPAGPEGEALPRAVGKYQVRGLLGRGGMGEVFDAFDPKLRRRVAIKRVARARRGVADARARFWREARALAALNHPGIVGVYEIGETDEGDLFIAMEFVDGRALADLIGSPWPAPFALEVIAQAAEALGAAHDEGITHRDIKPANIMVYGDGSARVVDFGLARRQDAVEDRITQTGAVVGTAAYMAPEQVHGQSIGPPADVFALGVTLYRLLAGVHPFSRGSTAATAIAVATAAHTPLGERCPELPEAVAETVERCLRVDPDARFPDGTQLARVLRELLTKLDQPHEQAYSRFVAELAGVIEGDESTTAQRAQVGSPDPQFLSSLDRAADGVAAPVPAPRATRSVGVWIVALALLAGVGSLVWMATRGETPSANPGISTGPRPEAPDAGRAGPGEGPNQRQRDPAQEAAILRAEGLVGKADARMAAARWEEADQMIAQAQVALAEAGADTRIADLARFDLYRQAPVPLMSLEGHATQVRNVKISRDQRLAVTASGDRTLKLWHVPTGRELRTLTGHEGFVRCASMTSDSKLVASCSLDQTARIWSVDSGEQLHVLESHTEQVYGAAFSPDDKKLVTGSADMTLRLWDVATGEEQGVYRHQNGMMAAGFSPDVDKVFSADKKSFQVWDVASGNRERLVPIRDLEGRDFWRGFFTPEGDAAVLLTQTDKGSLVGVWDTQTGRLRLPFAGKSEYINVLDLSDDGRWVLTRGDRMRLWDARTGREVRSYLGAGGTTSGEPVQAGIDISADGALVVAGDNEHRVHVWPAEERRDVVTLVGHEAPPSTLELLYDGRVVRSVDKKGVRRTVDVTTGLALVVGEAPEPEPRGVPDAVEAVIDDRVAALPEGSVTITTVAHEGQRIVVSIQSHDGVSGPAAEATGEGDAAVRVSEARVVNIDEVANYRHQMLVFAADSGELLVEIPEAPGPLGRNKPSLSPDGGLVVGIREGLASRTPVLFRLEEDPRPVDLEGHAQQVVAAAASADRRLIATTSIDRTIRLWDGDTGRPLRTLEDDGIASHVALSPKGRVMATAYGDGRVRVWELGRAAGYRALVPAASAAIKALRADPADAEALATLGQWYAFRGMWTWARELLRQARDTREGTLSSAQWLALAQAYWVDGYLDEAERAFGRAAETEAAPAAYLQLSVAAIKVEFSDVRSVKDEILDAMVLQQEGDHAIALAVFDSGVERLQRAWLRRPSPVLTQTLLDARWQMARSMVALGKHDEASAILVEVFAANSADRDGVPSAVVKDLNAAARLIAETLTKAASTRWRGDPERAVEQASEAIRHDPSYRDAFRVRARAFRELGDKGRAAQDCLQALGPKVKALMPNPDADCRRWSEGQSDSPLGAGE